MSFVSCYTNSMLKISLFFLIFVLCFAANAALPASINGESLVTSKPVSLTIQNKDKKGTVIIFMSAKCPCSDSHLPLIKNMATRYKDFKFAVVHSNLDETKAESQKYFKKAGLMFDVIQDVKTQIADQFQAYKTPHAFILNPNGEIIYQGGVTNSSHASAADEFFLEKALSEINSGKTVSTPEGRTLGCVILRESEIK